MNKPRKEDIIAAFKAKHRKRNKLLYEYYRESYFTGAYNAFYVAGLIREELGIAITPNMVYKIRSRYSLEVKAPVLLAATHEGAQTPFSPLPTTGTKSRADKEKTQQKYVLKNEEQYPKSDPYKGQLDDL